MDKSRKDILVVGRLPPPITGENLCRSRLVDVLRAGGRKIVDFPRSVGFFWVNARILVLLNGRSIYGTIFDVIATCWSLVLGRRVYWYFHNASWRRFVRLPVWMWCGFSERIHVLVLRPLIAAHFKQVGYQVTILNNRIESVFEEKRKALPPCPPKRLIWMGRPDESKGFPLALEVFAMLHDQDSGWHFDVYGADNTYAEVNDYVRQGVRYHGFINGYAKVDAFCIGGIFILPSRYKDETQPLSIIEALSCGIPVVAGDVGGIAEMLAWRGKHAGYSLASQRAFNYVEAISEILANYATYSDSGRWIYDQRFSSRIFEKNVASIFSAGA